MSKDILVYKTYGGPVDFFELADSVCEHFVTHNVNFLTVNVNDMPIALYATELPAAAGLRLHNKFGCHILWKVAKTLETRYNEALAAIQRKAEAEKTLEPFRQNLALVMYTASGRQRQI